jgi:hypothetical protein
MLERSPPKVISFAFPIHEHTRSTMGIEEQKEEREILESIYPDEITG